MRQCARCGTAYAGDERFCSLDGGPVIEARAAADPLVGRTLGGRYLLIRAIGKGGMGAVYAAEHVGLGKRVAVKLLLDQFSEDREVLARFHQEARTASRIGHENIIDILDIGDHEGRSYIAMEFLEGTDLRRAYLGGKGPMPLARALPILGQIALGLHAAHQKGVIHRDMKPENVFLTERGARADFVKIMDFGISKIKAAHDSQVRLTQTGAVIGTPMYMAPEQGMGRTDIDHRADVYSVGVMMFELLCGRPPFEATTYLGLMTQHLQTPPPPPRSVRPELPPALEAIILRALEKEPARRWQSMQELGEALAGVGAGGVGAGTHTVLSGSGALSAPVPVAVPAAPSGALAAPVVAAPSAAVAMPPAAAVSTQAKTTVRRGGGGRAALWLGAVAAVAAAVAVGVVLVQRRGAEVAAGTTEPAAPRDPGPGPGSGSATGPEPAPAVQPLEQAGSLEVDSTPRGATVFVDGEEHGHTPLVIEKVAAGPHKLRLELPGYEVIELDKPVRPGTAETFFGAMSKARKGSKPTAPATAPATTSPPANPPAPAASTPDAGTPGPPRPTGPGSGSGTGSGSKSNPYTKKPNPYK
jgi:serine/threonine-protein kinase